MHKAPTEAIEAPGWARSRRGALLACAVLALAVALLSLVTLSTGGRVKPLGMAQPVSDASGAAPAGVNAGAAAPMYVTVHIKNYAFAPANLTVTSGTTVTWINDDTASHTVTTTSAPKAFDSKELKTGQSFSYTFVTPGTYAYYCAYHPDMKATVAVSPMTSPSPTSSGMPSPGPTGLPTGIPSVPPSTVPSTAPSSMPTNPGGGTPCNGELSAILNTVLQHIYVAHLDRSPSEQVTDLLNLDQYVKTHTAWAQMILQEGGTEAQQALTGLIPLLQHLYMAHLEASPADQVTAILAVDQYVKTHTVLVEDILKPGLDGLLGGGTSC